MIAQPAQPLFGLGGVGKTEIAAEYAHRHRDDYDLCWWIRCEREDAIVNSLLALGRMMQLPDFRPEERDYSIGLVIAALNRGQPFGKWLLIFDNVTNAEMISQFIPQGPGHVIITSRDSYWRKALRSDGIEVGEFQPEETIKFLQRRVAALAPVTAESGAERRDIEAASDETAKRLQDAAELAAELAHLPLAAEHAAAYLVETATSPGDYLQLYRANAHKLLATDLDIPYPHAVATTWSVASQTISQDADAVFKLVAFFAPEPIYEELLLRPGRATDLGLPSRLETVLGDTTHFRRAARELHRFSLIKINAVRNVFQVHRVVQAVTQGQLERDDPAAAEAYRAAAHTLLAASDPDAPNRDDSEEAYERSRQHLLGSGALESENPLVRRLIRNQVRRLHRRGGFAESLGLGEPALAIWREKFQNDRETLSLAVEVGFALRRIGRWQEAADLDQATLKLLKEQFGEENQAYLTCARSYGLDLAMLGRYAEALKNDEGLLELYDRVYQLEELESLQLRNNLAVSLRCLGRFEEALEYDRQILDVRTRILGPVDTGTLTSRFAVARDLRRLAYYEEALDECRAVNDMLAQKNEPWNQFRLLAGVDMAICLRRAGYLDDAVNLAEELLPRYVRTFGEDNRETLWAYTNLMMDLRRTGDLAGAQDLGERAVAGWEKTIGPDHPNTVAAVGNLAVVLRENGNPAGARDLNERALRDFIKVYGEDHPSTLIVQTNLASDLAVLGEARKARELGETTWQATGRTRGENHLSTLTVAANLSIDRRADNDPDAALELHNYVMTRLHETMGPEHPEYRRAAQHGRLNLDLEPMHT
ncbi:MAG TPA: FxSxx-COOH system tetratricopeptide repeat protein [Streptosporangiaceae bacterium]|nr:FxSxx-COOH system tetratricopeptide repeat protein [Streptosporangiaceae bacterium]